MSTKQQKRVLETKQKLMDAYWELYTADMPGKITVKMITDRAGYNRGTFYAYFLDIADLHQQIEDGLLPSEEDFEKLRAATFSKNSREIIEIFMQRDRASGDKIRFLLSAKGSLSFQNKLKNKLRDLILKYAALDLQEPENIVNYKVSIVCSIFYETLCYWYDRGQEYFSGDEMILLMLKIIFLGVAEGQVRNGGDHLSLEA